MRRCRLLLITYFFLLWLPARIFGQNASFDADSAFAYLKHLCVTIGPRPMGSVNERTALQWTVDNFRRFGADTAYIMIVPEATTPQDGTVNTSSGVAIGIFRGSSDSTIVIGGHIDSSGREIPGANDDASGTACMIELARVWSQRPRRYTLLFAAFGGEESGLIGSKYFVEHYPALDKVALMLQIDMAGSEESLIPFLEVESHQAPVWLVEDAYAIDRALGYNSLYYPTHFFSINNAFHDGGAGSDHQPFLRKNIPAIDFTAGVNTSPIHTPQDKIEFIDKPMLSRSGRLVDGLSQKYQEQGIPAPRQGNYMLWQAFGGRLYIYHWMIIVTDIFALVLGALAFFRSRKQRLQIEKAQRAKFSGTKLFLMMIIIAIFMQLGEALMQFLKGLRYPWMVPFEEYLWFAALWALAGIWFVSQLTRKWRFSPDPYVYAKRAAIFLFAYTILMGLASARLALYPALALIALSLAIFSPGPIFKVLFMLIAPIPMLRLMFMETLPLWARSFAENGHIIDGFIKAFLYSAALTLILVLWYLPFVYFFAYSFASLPPTFNALKAFRRPMVCFMIFLAICGYGGYLFSFPAYSKLWHASLVVNAEYNPHDGESKLDLIGNEYFHKVRVKAATLERQYDARVHHTELPLIFTANWVKLSSSDSVLPGARDTVVVDWRIVSARPWYRVSMKLQADTLDISDIVTNVKYRHRKSDLTFTWYADPPDTLQMTGRFSIHPDAKLSREITAVYADRPMPIQVTAENADVLYRTTVTLRDTLKFTKSPQ